jgi:hypothetical protein
MTVKYNFKTKPYSHQQIAMDLAGQRDAFGFFMEMGTGKSKVLIDNIGTLYQSGGVKLRLGHRTERRVS